MPELPDLQVFAHNLNKKLKNKTVDKISIVNKSKLKTSAASVQKALEGQKLKEIYREGKQLRFKFDNDAILGMHLMLHGKLYIFEEKQEHKNAVVEIYFDDDTGLVLTDYQGMASISLNPEEENAPDALNKSVNYAWLKEQLNGTRSAIKNVLLDQKKIRGIGNAYADEILWEAGISPFSASNKIPDDKIKDLAKAIHSVLKDAEKQISKSNPDIINGEVRDFLKIHNWNKKESPTGGAIQQKTAGGRKTYYTDEQELYK